MAVCELETPIRSCSIKLDEDNITRILTKRKSVFSFFSLFSNLSFLAGIQYHRLIEDTGISGKISAGFGGFQILRPSYHKKREEDAPGIKKLKKYAALDSSRLENLPEDLSPGKK